MNSFVSCLGKGERNLVCEKRNSSTEKPIWNSVCNLICFVSAPFHLGIYERSEISDSTGEKRRKVEGKRDEFSIFSVQSFSKIKLNQNLNYFLFILSWDKNFNDNRKLLGAKAIFSDLFCSLPPSILLKDCKNHRLVMFDSRNSSIEPATKQEKHNKRRKSNIHN